MARARSSVEEFETGTDGRPKPCKGLHGVYCGLPRKKNQTYCAEHQSQYQRERYAAMRKESGRDYSERIFTRTTNVMYCGSCKNPKPEGLHILHGLALPPICSVCKELFDLLRMEFGWEGALRVVEFIYHNAESIRKDGNEADATFEAWFKAKIDAHMDRFGWPEGREDCENHFRASYKVQFAEILEKRAMQSEVPKSSV